MRIIGIDPGYAIVGVGCIDYEGNRFKIVEYGAITTEAGEDMTFASYMDGYLRHMTAKAALSMTVRAISHESGEFTLHSFAAETVPVLAEKTFYFENERYRVGVELCWGGGLSYLEDKKCPVEGLVNILNNFDTGCSDMGDVSLVMPALQDRKSVV